jgi:nucleoside-diphosphate-sugar epimerase
MNILVTGCAGFINSVLPGREAMLPEPAPPYAISKPDCEHLARVFYNDHGLCTTCLRYFNVYGPRQDHNSAYAAAIPILLFRARGGEDIVIYGDGDRLGILCMCLMLCGRMWLRWSTATGEVFNVATGVSVTIRELAETIVEFVGRVVGIVYEDERAGDVRNSRADVGKIARWWRSEVELTEGLRSIQ